ncbi:SDR family oxidoreductase [Streptomyces ipomoeae]|uniref:NAD-binding protein n=2 Tax=Streptomyces ipomoeae TaxID=103232 RepID=L1L252_9ACTN|nr:SDR family oxidoreductase [Streptomyces ipomoeae]EKX66869.1 NAD-binding protein [Streptomyces ipomoeae 91-03]MDX2693195.1 SDR family oxidoreductase [Streptomyces ipomoeae]MDX2820638.1 SDR family oxidoreductase [Streptomyces ipomoeae]MDX2838693.1 SDR family oxidoreductase [Streptomyces ipomoeae]MDX2873146.1 SDR family oxidoreductase [Streptomyces ipomoeae]
MILVTGATGKVGRNVVELLVAGGVKARALTRDPAAGKVPEGAEVVAGDLMADPDGLGDALQGVDAVFLNAAAFLDLAGVGPQAATFLALAKRRGVGRVVLLTSGTVHDGVAADQQPSVISRMHRTIEDAVEASGMEWTLLRPGEFMANSLDWAPQIRASDIVRAPYGDAMWAPIHERDIAEVAVRALTEDGHSGATYRLSGPEPISYHERARLIGEALGRPVRLEEIPPDAARSAMVVRGVPTEVADALLALSATGVEHPETVSPTVRELTGQPGRTFAQWARENAAAFRGR